MTSIETQAKSAAYLATVKERWPRLHTLLVHHRNTHGEQMTVADKPWWLEMAKDNADDMVVVKCSQVGITELFLGTMFALAATGHRGMYLLPTGDWRSTFVADRIDKLVDVSPAYAAAVKKTSRETDAKTYKNIHGMGWKFAGTASPRKEMQPKAAFEFPADVLFIDEFDQHNQDNLVYFYDRITKSRKRKTFKFGNPTVGGRGIWQEFLKSSMQQWAIKCDKCGTDNVLEWHKHFVRKTETGHRKRDTWPRPQCQHCSQGFDRLGEGRWVATNPKSKISGYQLSRLFILMDGNAEDMEFLWEKFQAGLLNQTRMQNFMNNYLGVTYENTDEKLTDEVLRRCASPTVGRVRAKLGGHQTVAGIDQGKNFHVVISATIDGTEYLVKLASPRTWDELESLLDEYNVGYAVIDAQGGGYMETRQFIAQRENRLMCYYVGKDRVQEPFHVNDETGVVQTNRTEAIDTAVARFRDGAVRIQEDWESVDGGEFKRQMTVPNRVLDAGGRPVWTSGNDHYFHAYVYNTLAKQAFGVANTKVEEITNWRV
jgi:hypothetical protein